MLVFRRAISLLLTSVMVFAPSLALGRNGTKSHKFVPQEKDAFKKSWAKHDAREKVKQRKIASVEAAAAAAKGPFKSQQAALDTLFQELKIKGQRYSYTTIPGKNGTAKAQILRGTDFESIFVDEYNTGTASKWEIKKGDTTVVADRPYRGRFSHIEITQPRAKSILKVDLQMNPDLKTYRLASVKLDAYKIDHDQTNAMCSADLSDTLKSNITTMESFLDDLKNKTSKNTAEDALTCRVTHNQRMLFDKSCFEGQFATSADDMARAYAKVFGTRGTSAPPRMLQCVEQLGYAYQSSKMQADFMVMNTIARTETVNNGNWKPEMAGAETDCKRLDSIPVWNGTKWSEDRVNISEFFLSEKKPIRCDSSLPGNEAGRTVDGQVVIGKPSAWMAANRGRGSAVDGYAALLLHEFMHKTGLPEDPYETLVGQVQECCADPSIKTQADFDKNDSCQRAAKHAKEQMDERSHNTEMSIYYPGYTQIYDTVQNRLQQNTRNPSANQFMSDWYSAMQSNPKARATLDALKECEERSPDKPGPCIDKAYDSLKDFNNSYMSNQCKAGVRSGVYKDINCDDLKNVFKTAMTNARTSPAVIIDPTIPRLEIADRQVTDIIRYDDVQLAVPIDVSKLDLQPINIPSLTLAGSDQDASGNSLGGALTSTASKTVATTKTSGAATGTGATTTSTSRVATNATNGTTVRTGTQTQTQTPQTQTSPNTQTRTQAQNPTNTQTQNVQPATTTTARTNTSNTTGATGTTTAFTVGGVSANTQVSSTDSPSAPADTGSGTTDVGNQNQTGTTNPSVDSGYVPTTTTNIASSTTSAPKPTSNIRMASNSILSGGSTNQPKGYGSSAAPVSNALIQVGSNIGSTLGSYANTIANRFEGTAYAAATGPRPDSTGRQPAAISQSRRSYASSGAGAAASRLIPTRLGSSPAASTSGGGTDQQPNAKAQAALAAAPLADAADTIDPEGAPKSVQAVRANDAQAAREFGELNFRQPNDVVVGLAKISPDTLTREMARGESSPIIKTLRANGWSMTVSRKSRTRVLVSPSGRCYAPGRRGVVPLASCG